MPHKQHSGRAFASDNWAGVHPEVLEAMAAANVGHVPSYGTDPYTHDAVRRIGAELGGGYFRGLAPSLVLDWPALLRKLDRIDPGFRD